MSPFYHGLLFFWVVLVGLTTFLVIGFTANNGCSRSIINIETCHKHGRGIIFFSIFSSLVSLSLDVAVVNLKKMLNNASPVLKVSFKLNDENGKKNSLTSLEPIGTKFSVLHCIRIPF